MTSSTVGPVDYSPDTETINIREFRFSDRSSTELARYRRKIGIGSQEHNLTMTRLDSVARWPARPPIDR